jgi:hypothetical protein
MMSALPRITTDARTFQIGNLVPFPEFVDDAVKVGSRSTLGPDAPQAARFLLRFPRFESTTPPERY